MRQLINILILSWLITHSAHAEEISTNSVPDLPLEQQLRQVENNINQTNATNFIKIQNELHAIKQQLAELSLRCNQTSNLTPKVAAPKPKTPPANLPSANTTAKLNAEKISATVYNLIKEKKYPSAIKYLRDMLNKNPSGYLAADMHYWLGNLYSLIGKHEQALAEFALVSKLDPHNAHCADAQLKIGLIYIMQNNWVTAKNIFRGITSKFPGSKTAKLALEQLQQLHKDGH